MFEVFKRFFLLGWVSFGGPAAHIGYFHKEFVEKRQWLSQQDYAQMVALSQFLPGPGSSQVGFALGYQRAGILGGLAAFLGFTIPSVIIMLVFATLNQSLLSNEWFMAIIHGLKLLAVVVVSDAIIGMWSSFCKQKRTQFIALAMAVLMLLLPGLTTQMLGLLAAAVIGSLWLGKDKEGHSKAKAIMPNWLALSVFAGLFVVLPFMVNQGSIAGLFNDFYQAGALVFGGGHVVLPLLQNIVGEQLSNDAFLAGYGAAQGVPGPMFTLATFLGFEANPDMPIIAALVATLAIFLPGLLLVVAFFNSWQSLANNPVFAGAAAAINAAVVGLLIAALYQPIFTSSVVSDVDAAIVILGFGLLRIAKLPILALIGYFILAAQAAQWLL